MENLKDYLFYGSLNKRDWNRVRDVIWEKDNRIILLTVSFSMFILMTFLTIYTVFWDKVYQENAPAYGVVAALELVLYLFAKSATKSNMASLPLLTFVFNLVTFALGIDLGTFLDPNSYALAFVVMVIVLPMLFCVRPIHSVISVVFVDVVFLMIAHSVKSPDIFYSDVMNVVIWSFVGLFLNGITTTARVRGRYELYKNEESQKEIHESFKRVAIQMSMFKSLGNIYSSLYYIDLKTDSYVELVSLPDAGTVFGNSGGDVARRMRSYCESVATDAFKKKLIEFADLRTVNERLKKQNLISMQYLATPDKQMPRPEWYEINLIVVDRDENAFASSVLFAVRRIHEEKQNEMDQMEKLQSALAAAESANKSKTVFLNNVNHDIRTPMNAIISFTELAQKNSQNPAVVADYLNKISVANKHLLSLVNDVLDMSRMESGRMNLNPRAESFTSIVEEVKTMMQDDFEARRQNFNVKMDALRNDMVLCDRLRVKQVLLNLLSNAAKFTPDGGKIDFEVGEMESSKPGSTALKIKVRDNGVGMSEGFLRKIFEPFEREFSSKVNGILGTGLGMSIAKNLMDMMGGTIYIQSTQNVGTEVLLEVTFEIASEEDVREWENQEDSVSCAANQFVGRRILLMDDNRMNQMMTTHLLKDSGVEILIAENGQVGCDMLEKNGAGFFDLVLLDVQMPVMDGYETTRVIRNMKDKSLAEIPIIAMTADSSGEDCQRSLAIGVNDYISKPVEAKMLYAALLKILG